MSMLRNSTHESPGHYPETFAGFCYEVTIYDWPIRNKVVVNQRQHVVHWVGRGGASLSRDRIGVYACSISLTAEKEDLGAIGFNIASNKYEATGMFQESLP